jgi:hypothetical protein
VRAWGNEPSAEPAGTRTSRAERLGALSSMGVTDTVLIEGSSDLARRRARQGRPRRRCRDRLPVGRPGDPAAAVMAAVVTARSNRATPHTWIEIGFELRASTTRPALARPRLQNQQNSRSSKATVKCLGSDPWAPDGTRRLAARLPAPARAVRTSPAVTAVRAHRQPRRGRRRPRARSRP